MGDVLHHLSLLSPPSSDWNFTHCAKVYKEHSGASRECVWLSVLRLDMHSLLRQPPELVMKLAQDHLLPSNARRNWPQNRLKFLLHVMAAAHQQDERCRRREHLVKLLSTAASAEFASLLERPTLSKVPSAISSACGPLQRFDNRLLPFRWLPGLPVPPHGMSRHEAEQARRLEVMHIADYVRQQQSTRPLTDSSRLVPCRPAPCLSRAMSQKVLTQTSMGRVSAVARARLAIRSAWLWCLVGPRPSPRRCKQSCRCRAALSLDGIGRRVAK
jgi:hypothetical protein